MCLELLPTVHTPVWTFHVFGSTFHSSHSSWTFHVFGSTFHSSHSRLKLSCVWIYFPQFRLQAEPFMCLDLLPTVQTPGWTFHVFGSTSHSSHSRLNLSCVWLYFLQFTLQADALSWMVKEAEARDQETEAASLKCSQGKGHWPWSGSAACCWPDRCAPCRRQPVGCGMSSLSCWSGVALCPSSWWHQTAPAIDFFMMLVIAKHNGIH